MEPTREKVHRDWHLFSPEVSSRVDLLRTAVLYGANASGKSNFIRAFEYAKRIITRGLRPKQPTNVPYFKLDQDYKNRPSEFYFEIQTTDCMFAYEFHLSMDSVVFEELCEFTKTSRKVLFTRRTHEDNTNVEFSPQLEKQHKPIIENIKFVADGTRRNQLFLTETIERNLSLFEPIYDWFNESAKILSPTSFGHGIEFRLGEDKQFTDFLVNFLSAFDPSITGLDTNLIDLDSVNYIPARILQEIENELGDDEAVFISNMVDGNRSVVLRKEGKLMLLRMFIQRKCSNSNTTAVFELEEESDGTRRLIDLAPVFFELLYSEKTVTVFIDELDRSLHPLATKILLEAFLRRSSRKNSMSQIVISTHNSVLLDQDLLRKDELWIMNKNDGVSELISLQRDFSPRYDKDIRKEYLEGKYGGVPDSCKDRLLANLLNDEIPYKTELTETVEMDF